jgi:chromosome partitioning protein
MRIRRRDRGEPTPPPPTPVREPVEPLVVPEEDFMAPSPPPASVHRTPDEIPPSDTPPPFDQALLAPPAAREFVSPSAVQPTPSAPPSPRYQGPDPIETSAPIPPVDPQPDPISPGAEPVFEGPPITAPDPYGIEDVQEVVARDVVVEHAAFEDAVAVQPAELPGEPKHAREPKPAPASPAATQMRAPTIRADADSLLDGERPAPRELPRVIAIANQKGGVGKTTTTVNLGAALAEIGYRVLVIDLDPQGNATTGLGIDARNFELSMYDVIMRDQSLEDCIEPTSVKNLFVAPATIDLAGIEIELVPAFSREMKLKRAIDTVVDDFDFILIDCPPSLGLITVNGLAAAGEVLVPIQCEYYALEGLSQLLRNVNLVSSNLNESLEVTTIVLTMFDARTRLSIEVANEVRLHFADRVCKSVIPRTVRLSEAPSFGQPITVFDPTSRGAVAYRELALEVSNGAPQRTR